MNYDSTFPEHNVQWEIQMNMPVIFCGILGTPLQTQVSDKVRNESPLLA